MFSKLNEGDIPIAPWSAGMMPPSKH